MHVYGHQFIRQTGPHRETNKSAFINEVVDKRY